MLQDVSAALNIELRGRGGAPADGTLGALLAQLLRALVAHAHVAAGDDGDIAVIAEAYDAKPLVAVVRGWRPARRCALQMV